MVLSVRNGIAVPQLVASEQAYIVDCPCLPTRQFRFETALGSLQSIRNSPPVPSKGGAGVGSAKLSVCFCSEHKPTDNKGMSLASLEMCYDAPPSLVVGMEGK